MIPKDILDLFDKLDEQKATRSDADPDELLLELGAGGEKRPQTFDEFNASGEEMKFLCMRVKDVPRAPIRGAVRKTCEVCGELVWMSPGTCEAWLKIKKSKIYCPQCCQKELGPLAKSTEDKIGS